MISCFNHIKDPNATDEIDIYEFVERIKSPDKSIIVLIEQARLYHNKDKDKYDGLKAKLPCFTLNFSFNGRKTNETIKSPTGFIYLDVDNCTSIDLSNPFIFATWLSPSNTGRGVLVKVENLNLDNFKDTYSAISKHLNLNVDIRAAKATQYTIHSYDKGIYFNEDAITWVIDTSNEAQTNFTPTTSILKPILKRKRKDIGVIGVNYSIRYNNYNEVDFGGKEYLYFKDEKIVMATVFVPKAIKKGSRNSIVSAIAYQLRALNPHIAQNYLQNYIETVNLHHCKPKLRAEEISTIVRNIMNRKNLIPVPNNPRRFLFNPKFKLPLKEIMGIVNYYNGKARSEKTINKIRECILNWDVAELGKLTQKSLIKASGVSKGTIEKYYKLFEEERKLINQQYNKLKTS
ncbi:BT4734/BF3469 family protein [uncultured Polaribacter sp.]|uniref:BT4734/BF3469 family protein n=1 Tax=uncultured Polaribacter sp. TaxID=174711 RepID=UPI002603EE4F|nr:BT4734/BF3469 family protein [uncultured Polaribacter sp.]